MKLRAADKVHYDSGPNMTPLVDIVMVILIFLMLTGTFALGEHFLQSNTALSSKGSGGVQLEPGKIPDEPLSIRLDGFSRPGPDGVTRDLWQAQAGGYTAQSREVLTAQLKKMREAMNRNNIPTDRIQVFIAPSRVTKYKHIIEVYEAALDAGLTKVGFEGSH